jgi:hypothetical protein
MSRSKESSSVLTIRIGTELKRLLEREARRRRRSKSELVRELLEADLGLEKAGPPLEEEAQRQSILVSGRDSERAVLELIEQVADDRGWQ